MTFEEIEELYRSYPNLKIRRDVLKPLQELKGKSTRDVDETAVRLSIITRLHRGMTNDERQFIVYRYEQRMTMEQIEDVMHWSRTEIFKLRKSVLTKSRWLLSLRKDGPSGRSNGRKQNN